MDIYSQLKGKGTRWTKSFSINLNKRVQIVSLDSDKLCLNKMSVSNVYDYLLMIPFS